MNKIAVVAFAFGSPYDTHSNQAIAEIAIQKAREVKGQVYTQPDIQLFEKAEVTYFNERGEKPPTTLQLARGAVLWATRCNINELWIACALPHLARCERDLDHVVEKSHAKIKICVCSKVFAHGEDFWFAENSKQEWTRTKKAWEKREGLIMSLPMWSYKIITS